MLQIGSSDNGAIGRSIDYLFQKLIGSKLSFTFRLTCLEIYQDQVYDLLTDERDRVSLPVREHSKEGFYVEGCKMVPCATPKIAYRQVDCALKSRQVGSHNMNHRSNRSHFIVEMAVDVPPQRVMQSREHTNPALSTAGKSDAWSGADLDEMSLSLCGKITFVDLAGSERLKDTNSSGKMLQETGAINKSLYVLGKVISGLSRGVSDVSK
jgi:hypothetical protein